MLEIIYANYGTMDVTEQLKNMIINDMLSVTVENTTFGKDPLPNVFKNLTIKYKLNNEEKEIKVPEHTTLKIPEQDNTLNDVFKIFEAWRINFDSTNPQANLAIERIKICDSCDFKVTTPILNGEIYTRCTVCGCSLKGKIYTPRTYKDPEGSCPKEYWKPIEN